MINQGSEDLCSSQGLSGTTQLDQVEKLNMCVQSKVVALDPSTNAVMSQKPQDLDTTRTLGMNRPEGCFVGLRSRLNDLADCKTTIDFDSRLWMTSSDRSTRLSSAKVMVCLRPFKLRLRTSAAVWCHVGRTERRKQQPSDQKK